MEKKYHLDLGGSVRDMEQHLNPLKFQREFRPLHLYNTYVATLNDNHIQTCRLSSERNTIQLTPSITKSSRGTRLDPKWKQFLPITLLLSTTFLWLVATTWLSIVSSSSRPPTIFSRPEWTVLVLSLLSNGSLFLLGELTSGTCEILRWTIGLRSSGVGIATFLGLSRATSNFGVLSLLFSNQNVGHRRWCSQRYLAITNLLILDSSWRP